MKVRSDMLCDEYLSAMKAQMGSFFDFGNDRFTGIFIGRLFSVTYHAGYEWNRRITNEKHRAIGLVRPINDGTEVLCVHLAGMTNPLSLIFVYFLSLLICFVSFGNLAAELYLISLGLTFFIACISALGDSITERGEEASRILTSFLLNPSDYYSLL